MSNHYSIYGLNITSPIWLPSANSDTFQNVDLSLSEHPLFLSDVTARNAQWQTNGYQLLSTLPNLGQALIKSPENITIYANPNLCKEHLLTFALGSGLAGSLYLNQFLPLHGASVSTGKGAILFLGASGRGKSTLALAAANAGWKVFTDDVISLHGNQGQSPIKVYPSHRRFKAQCDTAVKLGLLPDTRYTTAPGTEKHPCYIPIQMISQNPEPIKAIYLLQQPNANHNYALQQLAPHFAIDALSKHCYRPGLIKLLKKQQQLFSQSVQLAKQAPLYKLWLPSFNYCGSVAGFQHWLNEFLQQHTL
ncbi:hypothetical protein [Rheinheimera sp. UJ63]|uniref:hypothetical protein n=1 Tax=Rheinheimera sp. UJ63 TaxID=2910157 RepID=UPI001F4928AE|nr:hypothetical protein [Rheinheimera sp. UJ63]MCF4009298.1 hypothetical protein [Rheinheimera sp. UJ63]